MSTPGYCTACNLRPSLPVAGFHFCEVCAVQHASSSAAPPIAAIIARQASPDHELMPVPLNLSRPLSHTPTIADIQTEPSAPANSVAPGTSITPNRERTTFPDLLRPPLSPAIFLCDVQDSMRHKIYSFYSVVNTCLRLIRYAGILDIPVFVTEQKPSVLGATASELLGDLAKLGPLHAGTYTKATFSMVTPEVRLALTQRSIQSVMIAGVEAHLSVLQTALDLLRSSTQVYIIVDGVSSRYDEETGVAINRLERAGAIITTSESIMFEILGDTDRPISNRMFSLSKSSASVNRSALRSLLGEGDEDKAFRVRALPQQRHEFQEILPQTSPFVRETLPPVTSFIDMESDNSHYQDYSETSTRVPVLLGVMSQCPDALYCENVFDRVLSLVGDMVEMDLTFLARVNESEPTYGVTCKHGVSECTGNIHELCAIHQVNQTDLTHPISTMKPQWRKWWDFVMCSNEGGRWEPGKESVGKDCAEKVGLQWEDRSQREGLKQCIHGDHGRELLKESIARTAKLGITNSCTVIINGRKRCVRDDDQWKECDVPIEALGEVGGFVETIQEEYRRLSVLW